MISHSCDSATRRCCCSAKSTSTRPASWVNLAMRATFSRVRRIEAGRHRTVLAPDHDVHRDRPPFACARGRDPESTGHDGGGVRAAVSASTDAACRRHAAHAAAAASVAPVVATSSTTSTRAGCRPDARRSADRAGGRRRRSPVCGGPGSRSRSAHDPAPQPARHRPGQELGRIEATPPAALPARGRPGDDVGARARRRRRAAPRPWRRPATAPPPARCGTSPGPPAPGRRPRRRRRPTTRRARRAAAPATGAWSRSPQRAQRGAPGAAATRARQREQGTQHDATLRPRYDVLTVRWIKESGGPGRCVM